MIDNFKDFNSNSTLYIFDFDHTLVDTPNFNDLVIQYLSEDVSSLLNNSLKIIGKNISDLNVENGRIYIDDENIIYAGKDNKGIHIVYILDKEGNLETIPLVDLEDKVKIFLGILDQKPWYAFDEKNNEINDINHRELMAKTVYYIRKIG